MSLLLAAILSLLIGITLGLLGGGGSILTLPMLVYVLEMEAKQSIASSLFVVGITSLVGVLGHARAGRVRWKTGMIFGLSGMAGAFAGGRIAAFLPGQVLLFAFGVVMLVTSIGMLRGRRERGAGELALGKTLGVGFAVGAVSGLVGAGGGFLIVPALNLFGGLPMPEAVATSLFVIALQSFAGLGGHVAHTSLDWQVLALVTGAAILGSVAGVRIARRLSAAAMRTAFGWFVLAMAIVFIGQQLPEGMGLPFVAVASLAVAATVAGRRWLAGRADAGPSADPQP